MRLSADERDRGYPEWWSLGARRHHVVVFLDGDVIKDAVTADDVEGIVMTWVHEIEVLEGVRVPVSSIDGRPHRWVRRGNVRIYVPALEDLK